MKWAIKNNERITASPKDSATCPICKNIVIPKCGVVKCWHWAHKALEECDLWAEPETKWHIDWKNEFPEENQERIIENHRADIKTDKGIIELQNGSISADDICDREKFYGNMVWLLNGKTLGKNLKINDKIDYFTFGWKNPPQSFFYADKPIYIDIKYFVDELVDSIDDLYQRLGIVYHKLEKLIKGNPHKFNFDEMKYSTNKSDKEVLIFYEEWSKLSKEVHYLEEERKKFGDKTIFFIKKLYKKIPCGGWGYLITKNNFLRRFS